jgi:hypothetical protein
MRKRNLIGLGSAATAACYLLVERSQTNGIVGFYRDTLSSLMFACWFAGFVVATISPSICAVSFWLLANRSRYDWILHFALVPVMYGVVRASAALMLFAAGEPDLDSLSGHAIVPAMVLLVACPIAYFVALGCRKIREIRQFARVR